MEYFWYCYIFIIGSIVGSFLNVCICRIPLKESIVTGRSHCTKCGHVLTFREMMPILSYLFLKGKCKNCKAPISLQYPLIELANAVLYLLAVLRYGFTFYALLLCIFSSVLLVTAGIDFHTMEIPNVLSVWISGLAILHILLFPSFFKEGLIGIFLLSVPMLLLSLLTNGFGGGDIKFCAACGFFLGYQLVLLGFFFACLAASVFGCFQLARKKADKKTAFAFGPYLAAGFLISALFGNQILSAYFALFH